MDQRAHRLIDRIYAAALEPDVWQEVSEGFSEIFGGSPVTLGFVLPGGGPVGIRYAVGIEPEHWSSYFEHLIKDLPWSARSMYEFADRWGHLGEVIV